MDSCLHWISFIILISSCLKSYGINEDICDLRHNFIYCSCEPDKDKILLVTCFVIGDITPDNEVWNGFRLKPAITELIFTSRIENQLKFIPVNVLKMLPNLETVQFKQAKLGTVEAMTFENLNSLENLLLESNEISELEPKSFTHLKNLSNLALSENLLTEIRSETFVDLPNLKELFLDRNNINLVEDGAFKNLSNLTDLELSKNLLTDLNAKMFDGLVNLRRLDLFRNKIERLSNGVFWLMPNLKELDLKDNSIAIIEEEAFTGLDYLMSLRMNNNKLVMLYDATFIETPDLMMIDLSNNKLHTLQSDVIDNIKSRFKRQFVLYFKGNPLKCTCDLWWWIDEYLNSTESLIWRKELRQAKCQPEGIDCLQTNCRVHKLLPKESGCLETTVPPSTPKTTKQATATVSVKKSDSHSSDEDHSPSTIPLVHNDEANDLKKNISLNDIAIDSPPHKEDEKTTKNNNEKQHHSSNKGNSGHVLKCSNILLFMIILLLLSI